MSIEPNETSMDPNETSFRFSQVAPNDNMPMTMTPLTRRSSQLESLKSNRRRCENLRVETLVASSSNFLATSSPQQTPPGSPQLTPNISSINSTLRPDSPASDCSVATLKFQRDLKQKFRIYQKSKHSQLIRLQEKLTKLPAKRT